MAEQAAVIDITPENTSAGPAPTIDKSSDAEGQNALAVAKQVSDLVIIDKPSYEQGREFLLTIKDRQKKLDEIFDPIINKAHQAHAEAIAQKRKFSDPLKLAETVLKGRISTFLVAEETKRKAEEDRLRLIAQKEEEERRLAAAIQAEAEGEQEEAQAILDEEPAFIPPPIVPKTVETGGGISMRENWQFKVENLMELVKAVAAGKVPLIAVQANTVFLGQQVRSLKSEMKYPGVVVWAEKTIAAGRK